MVDGGVGGRGRRGRAAGLDDGRAALGDGGDEFLGQPGLLDLLGGDLAVDLGVEEVWVLGGGVVAPDGQLLDVGDRHGQLLRQLAQRPVVVQAGHRGEPLGGHVRGVGLGDECVGVGRVADHQHAHVVCRSGVDGLALRLEDAAVGLQQVAALHALGARASTDQQRDVGAVERGAGIVGDVDAPQQRECAVVELHRGALGRLDRLRDLQQAELDRGVGPDELSGGDPEQQRVADLTGRTGDGHGDGSLGHEVSFSCSPGDLPSGMLSPARRCRCRTATDHSGRHAGPIQPPCAWGEAGHNPPDEAVSTATFTVVSDAVGGPGNLFAGCVDPLRGRSSSG